MFDRYSDLQGLNQTGTAVVRRFNVSHFRSRHHGSDRPGGPYEIRRLCDFGQRVRRSDPYEFCESWRAKEPADRGDRASRHVDQVLQREVVALGLAEAFTRRAQRGRGR